MASPSCARLILMLLACACCVLACWVLFVCCPGPRRVCFWWWCSTACERRCVRAAAEQEAINTTASTAHHTMLLERFVSGCLCLCGGRDIERRFSSMVINRRRRICFEEVVRESVRTFRRNCIITQRRGRTQNPGFKCSNVQTTATVHLPAQRTNASARNHSSQHHRHTINKPTRPHMRNNYPTLPPVLTPSAPTPHKHSSQFQVKCPFSVPLSLSNQTIKTPSNTPTRINRAVQPEKPQQQPSTRQPFAHQRRPAAGGLHTSSKSASRQM